MAKRTDKEVEAEIAALVDLHGGLPFARTNLQACIEALQDRMSVDQVYDQYDTEDTGFPYALDAAEWLAGATDTKPSEGWA